MMGKKSLLWALPILILGCSSKKAENCWEKHESQVSQILHVLSTIDQSVNAYRPEIKLLSESCQKRRYLIGEQTVIFKQDTQGFRAITLKQQIDPKACMQRAEQIVNELKTPYFEHILSTHKEKFQADWQDPDTMPVGWLNCEKSEVDFRESVGLLLHELNHNFKKSGDCIYVPQKKDFLCWHLGTDLPPRSLGRVDKFPGRAKDAEKLATYQKVYLEDMDQPFIMLLDELLAYGISSDYMTATLKAFKPDQKRTGVLLPLFYRITLNYLVKLRNDHPELYAHYFVEESTNRENLKVLFKLSENSFEQLKKQMKRLKLPLYDWEVALMQEAIATRKELHLF